MYYAAHNTHTDLNTGDHGFANTWEISRFATRAERDAFVERLSHKMARPVTDKEAIAIFARCYECEGKPVPQGGLFGDEGNRYGTSYFWNERYGEDS